MSSTTPCVIVLIAAYHEAQMISTVIKACQAQGAAQIVVVDDGSTDDTSDRARLAGVHILTHPVNRGKGAALLTGIEWIKRSKTIQKTPGAVIVFIDSDGQHDPGDIPGFITAFQDGAQVVLGVRTIDRSTPLVNRIGRYVGDLISFLHVGRYFQDTQCGYRAIRVDALPLISLEAHRYDFETQMLYAIVHSSLRITQVKVRNIYSTYSTTKKHKQGVIAGIKTLLSLLTPHHS